MGSVFSRFLPAQPRTHQPDSNSPQHTGDAQGNAGTTHRGPRTETIQQLLDRVRPGLFGGESERETARESGSGNSSSAGSAEVDDGFYPHPAPPAGEAGPGHSFRYENPVINYGSEDDFDQLFDFFLNPRPSVARPHAHQTPHFVPLESPSPSPRPRANRVRPRLGHRRMGHRILRPPDHGIGPAGADEVDGFPWHQAEHHPVLPIPHPTPALFDILGPDQVAGFAAWNTDSELDMNDMDSDDSGFSGGEDEGDQEEVDNADADDAGAEPDPLPGRGVPFEPPASPQGGSVYFTPPSDIVPPVPSLTSASTRSNAIPTPPTPYETSEPPWVQAAHRPGIGHMAPTALYPLHRWLMDQESLDGAGRPAEGSGTRR